MNKEECMSLFKWTTHKIKKNFSKKDIKKESVSRENISKISEPVGVEITTIAIVLDGEVQEVVRAEGRLAALLLSEPIFVETTDDSSRPTIGWRYEDNKFKPPVQDIEIEKYNPESTSDEI